MTEYLDGFKKFVEGVTGVVEANSFEMHCLHKEANEYGIEWKAENSGFILTIGYLEGRPICASFFKAKIRNVSYVLFYYPTSIVVDYDKVRAFLDKNMPQSAFKNGRLNHTDAQNAINVYPEVKANSPHPSHLLRSSWDASTYDFICEICGNHDMVPGGWGKLVDPCPRTEDSKV